MSKEKSSTGKKAKKKPKLTEEEKREQIREGLLRKKKYEDKALTIVEAMLEKNIQEDWLVEVLGCLNQGYYSDSVEERSLSGLCGYPLCDRDILGARATTKAKYRISLRDKKVYDLEERRQFCSNLCFKSSNHIKAQLVSSPLWLRDLDKPPVVELYKSGVSGGDKVVEQLEEILDVVGNEDHVDDSEAEEDHLEDDDHVDCEFPSSIDDFVDGDDEESEAVSEIIDKIVNIESTEVNLPRKDFLSENKTSKRAHKNSVKDRDTVSVVTAALRDWFTIDTYRLVLGEEMLKEALRKKGASPEVWAGVVGDKDLGEQFQARYRDLVRRLDMLDMLDEKEEEQTIQLPGFDQLRQHAEVENMKMTSFLRGKEVYELEEKSKLKVVEKKTEELEPRLPLLDHSAQISLRRRIVTNQLDRTIPELASLFGLSYELVRPGLKDMVDSFQLNSENVVFQPPEWSLLGLCLLKLLSVSNSLLRLAMETASSTKYINLMLLSVGLPNHFLDHILSDLTADLMPLLAKISLSPL